MKTVSVIIITAVIMLPGLQLSAQPSIGGFNVYYGHIQNHCEISDGIKTADYAYNYAKNTGHLDFFSLTDHSNMITPGEWDVMKAAAGKYNEPGVFTAFWGFEWTSGVWGHVAVINSANYVSTDAPTNTFAGLCNWLNANECVAFFDHPGRHNSTGQEFGHFSTAPSTKMVGMELWNRLERFEMFYYTDGYFTGDGNLSWYDEALTRGWKIGASGSEDNHWGSWGTLAQSKHAVLASANSRAEIMNAFKAKRFFTTYDKNLALSFKIGGNEMGSTIGPGSREVQIQASDANNEVFTLIQLLRKGIVINTWTPNSTNPSIPASLNCSNGDYYYVRLIQADGDEAISSPIWISGVDDPDDVVSCGGYTLPTLSNGAYFTNSGGNGSIAAGTVINTNQTIYINNGSAENSFTVTIIEPVTPTFNFIEPLCQISAAPGTLPTVSTNNIAGTWTPSSISTATSGITAYTFTPAAGQCATTFIFFVLK